jgi:diguanylate cyclase (GGDEF)-like protein/PAS domain S-box-containing protein
MWFSRVRALASDRRGRHFRSVLLMGPIAAGAILLLRPIHLVAPTPLWVIPLFLVGGQVLTTACGIWWDKAPESHVRRHARIVSQVAVVTATIYATGWGPALAVGLVLIGQETLATTGSFSQRSMLLWALTFMVAGQVGIALGWVPSIVPAPEVHGLAILMAIGIAFSYRSLAVALHDKEDAAALTDSRERRFRALVQSSSDLVFVIDDTSSITYASPSCSAVLGYAPEALLGPNHCVLIHDEELADLVATLERAGKVRGGTADFAFRVRHRDGSWRWLDGIATNLLHDPAVAGVVINARDITERRLRLVRQAALADFGRHVLQETLLEEVFTAAAAVVTEHTPAHSCKVFYVTVPEPNEPGLHVPVGDPEAPVAHLVVVGEDPLSEDQRQFVESVASMLWSAIVRSNAEDAIRHQAMHDPLTGLPNRTLFNDRLAHALLRRSRTGGFVGVMIVDLDGFKNVNDSLGHVAGDALLIAVAARLKSSLRGFDTIARLGGDEFAILVDDLDAPNQAGLVAQRVLDALIDPLHLPDREVAIGASIGIAFADGPDTEADLLLGHADAAMYRAKREGKGCYRVFEAAMHTAAVQRMNLEQRLRSAMSSNSLTVHYQPIIDVLTGAVTSFEALARWPSDYADAITPDIFIPIAEESGLIFELGHEVLLAACRQIAELRSDFAHLNLKVSVNVSPLQFTSPSFVDQVHDALQQHGLDPSALILEVTESVLAHDSGRVISALDHLRLMGVLVAIDDFGTGYSSLAALAELPIDILKIDKRFIDNLTHDAQGRGFVSAILQLAQTLQLATVAEGVEAAEQATSLTELGCTQVQGYLYAKPMPADQLRTYLASFDPIEHARESITSP